MKPFDMGLYKSSRRKVRKRVRRGLTTSFDSLPAVVIERFRLIAAYLERTGVTGGCYVGGSYRAGTWDIERSDYDVYVRKQPIDIGRIQKYFAVVHGLPVDISTTEELELLQIK